MGLVMLAEILARNDLELGALMDLKLSALSEERAPNKQE
jgi:hypothetical protein